MGLAMADKIKWTKTYDENWMGVAGEFEAYVGRKGPGLCWWTMTWTRNYSNGGAAIGGGALFARAEDAKRAAERAYG